MKDNNYPKDLSRRNFIISFAGTGVASLLAAYGLNGSISAESNPVNSLKQVIDVEKVCLLTPQSVEGPYFIAGSAIRRDIREDSRGQNLLLKIQVVDADNGCKPIKNAVVDIWHCDANGFYSGYPEMSPTGGPGGGMPPNFGDGKFPPPRDWQRPPGPPPNGMPPPNMGGQGGGMHAKPTSDQRFLRGVQVTDINGQLEFMTVYPGWYAPRAVHIHCKVFLNDKEMLTTQFYFPETLNDRIFSTVEPYKSRGANANKTATDQIAGPNPPTLEISESENLITGTLIIGVKTA